MMKILKAVALIGVATAELAAGTSAQAATLSFNFSFTEQGGGFVTGVIEGLNDNSTGSASSVRVVGNTAGFGLGEYVGNPELNSWTVSDGQITNVDFRSKGQDNTPPAVTGSSLLFQTTSLDLAVIINAGISDDPFRFILSEFSSDLEFSPVPIPAALPLFATGVAAVAYAGRRKRKPKAAA